MLFIMPAALAMSYRHDIFDSGALANPTNQYTYFEFIGVYFK